MMHLAFEKWHGCLNDFVVVWLRRQDETELGSLRRQAKSICDRHGGIGADGLLILLLDTHTDILPSELIIINSDGSEAATCGNGIRCAALSALKRHKEKGSPHDALEMLSLKVSGEEIICRYMNRFGGSGDRSGWPLVAVDMGIPKVDQDNPWNGDAEAEIKRVAAESGVSDLGSDAHSCDIGNRHLVFMRQDIDRGLLMKVAPRLQKSAVWDGINVHLAAPRTVENADQARAGKEIGQRIGERYEVLVWERGAGPTNACGSGACAVAAAAFETGDASRAAWVAVDMPGGRLYVKQAADDDPVTLAGPGILVFTGTYEL